jgi:hypothetical protein
MCAQSSPLSLVSQLVSGGGGGDDDDKTQLLTASANNLLLLQLPESYHCVRALAPPPPRNVFARQLFDGGGEWEALREI